MWKTVIFIHGVLAISEKANANLAPSTNRTVFAKHGGAAVIACRTDVTSHHMRWKLEKNGSDYTWINNGERINPKFVERFSPIFDSETGEGSLSIRNVQPKDSGYYRCSQTSSPSQSIRFQLIVVEADDTDNGNTETSSAETTRFYTVTGVAILLLICLIVTCVVVATIFKRRRPSVGAMDYKENSKSDPQVTEMPSSTMPTADEYARIDSTCDAQLITHWSDINDSADQRDTAASTNSDMPYSHLDRRSLRRSLPVPPQLYSPLQSSPVQ